MKVEKEPQHYKHLYIPVTKLTIDAQEEVILRSDDPKYRNVIISDAIRASSSLPLMYEPHKLYIKDENGQRVENSSILYVDGGIVNNYPIEVFDEKIIKNNGQKHSKPNYRTHGFALIPKKEYYNEPNEISDILDVIISTIFAFYNREIYKKHRKESVTSRTTFVEVENLSLFDFDPSPEKIVKARAIARASVDRQHKFFSDGNGNNEINQSSLNQTNTGRKQREDTKDCTIRNSILFYANTILLTFILIITSLLLYENVYHNKGHQFVWTFLGSNMIALDLVALAVLWLFQALTDYMMPGIIFLVAFAIAVIELGLFFYFPGDKEPNSTKKVAGDAVQNGRVAKGALVEKKQQ